MALAGLVVSAHADELADLKAQAAALEQQNQALTRRIDEIGRQQTAQEASTSAGVSKPAPTPPPGKPTLFGTLFGTTPSTSAPQSGGQTASGGAPTVTESRTAGVAPAIQAIGGTPPIPSANALTYLGITLYGTVDLGVTYQTHATPLNSQYGPGLEYLVSKNSYRSQVSVAPNALSYSNIGLKGDEPLFAGLSAVFDLQAQFGVIAEDV